MLISNSPNVEQMFNVDFLFFLSNCLINMFNSFDDPYPPPTATNSCSHSDRARDLFDDCYKEKRRHHANERKKLRQGLFGCSSGCRNRPNDDL